MIRLHAVTADVRVRNNSRSGRGGVTLLELLVVLVIIGVLVALLLPSVRLGGGAARRSQCKNNLKQIGLALHNYADAFGTLPPAYTVDADGKPLHSWRTLILPYIDQKTLYESIDLIKAWDDPANAAARDTFVPVYACPVSDLPDGLTTYLALTGPDEVFTAAGRPFPVAISGAGGTVAVVEVSGAGAVHWMEPRDTDSQAYEKMLAAPGLPHGPGAEVLLLDGSVQYISDEMPPADRPPLHLAESDDSRPLP